MAAEHIAVGLIASAARQRHLPSPPGGVVDVSQPRRPRSYVGWVSFDRVANLHRREASKRAAE